MSEATFDAVDSEAVESSDAFGDALEGEALGDAYSDASGEAYGDAYGDAAWGEASDRRRRRQLLTARQASAQQAAWQARQRRQLAAPAAPPRPAAGPSQAQAMAAVRNLNADTSAAVRALRRELEKAKRKGDMASYSAVLSVLASQALDTFEGNLEDHPLVRALTRAAPLGLLYGQGPQRGATKIFGNPIFIGGAGAAAILLAGKLVTDTKEVSTVVVNGPGSVAIGTPVQLSAVARDHKGNQVAVSEWTWTSDTPSVASVSSSGLVTGITVGSGPVWIAATSPNGVSNGLPVTVTPAVPGDGQAGPIVSSVTVRAARSTVAVNSDLRLGVVARDARGNRIPVANWDWQTSDPNIAVVNDGVVTGKNPGPPVWISATAGGESDGLFVTVQ
jgi:hypothetical protein